MLWQPILAYPTFIHHTGILKRTEASQCRLQKVNDDDRSASGRNLVSFRTAYITLIYETRLHAFSMRQSVLGLVQLRSLGRDTAWPVCAPLPQLCHCSRPRSEVLVVFCLKREKAPRLDKSIVQGVLQRNASTYSTSSPVSTGMGDRDRLRPDIPPRYVTKPTAVVYRSTEPCIPPGSRN